MIRILCLTCVGALALAGCARAPDPAAARPAPPETVSQKPAGKTFTVESTSGPVAFRPQTRTVDANDVPLLEQINRENIRVATEALPSVVRIIASRPADPRMRLFGSKILQLPFAGRSRPEVQPDDAAYSSGVILSRNGYILTNEHAVSDFNNFEVQLHDKRTFRARIVAADELVDVAILKIDATNLLPLPWGDSDKVQVGEQVFAIGNPFDLADSVSKGIVSAKGRNIPPQSEQELPHYEDFIQTDAAINPGNSGGALINIHGEMIGLNAAIASTTRLSMGIGFAIPSNLARYAVEGLFKEGHLVRGYLGVILPDSVDEEVVSQLDLKSTEGALLADIQPKSPAAEAKLHSFDFITAVDGHKIESEAGLRLVVAQLPVGKQVQVEFVRGGKNQTTTVQIGPPPADDGTLADSRNAPADNAFPSSAREMPPGANVLAGVQVTDLNDKTRRKFAVDDTVSSGVVVNSVQEGSPADLKGIQKGDVIESFSMSQGTSQGLGSAKDFAQLSGSLKADQGVVLLVYDSRRRNSFIYLAPPAK